MKLWVRRIIIFIINMSTYYAHFYFSDANIGQKPFSIRLYLFCIQRETLSTQVHLLNRKMNVLFAVTKMWQDRSFLWLMRTLNLREASVLKHDCRGRQHGRRLTYSPNSQRQKIGVRCLDIHLMCYLARSLRVFLFVIITKTTFTRN